MKRSIILAVLLFPLAMLCICCFDSDEAGQPKYRKGDLVRLRASGTRAQVIDVHGGVCDGRSQWKYTVRAAVITSRTNSKVLSRDGDISVSPVKVLKYLFEWELEPYVGP